MMDSACAEYDVLRNDVPAAQAWTGPEAAPFDDRCCCGSRFLCVKIQARKVHRLSGLVLLKRYFSTEDAQRIAEDVLNAPVSGIAAQRHIILRPAQTSLRSASLPQAHHSETALCSFSTPACSRRLRSSAPTMQLTTILARSRAMKGYTHTDSA